MHVFESMIDQITHKIEQELPGSRVEIKDPRKDGVHLEAYVIWAGFEGKSLIEQHKMVHKALGPLLKEIHALGIHTSLPAKEE